MNAPTYSDDLKAAVLAVYRADGPAAAVRAYGPRPCERTICRWAKQRGVVCVATTKKATEAANALRAVKRAELSVKLLDRATEMLDRMGETMKTWVGTGAKPVEVELDRPPASVCRDLATTVGILIDKLRLEAGQATDRVEVLALSEIDAEIARLEAQFANSPDGTGSAPAS